MKELYKIDNVPTIEKIEFYNEESNIFYRFQCKDWEIGEKSWGMIYSTEEEAIEDGCEILNGKSCCNNSNEMIKIADFFDKDFRILIVKGYEVEEGHDGEPVVEIDQIVEIWDFDKFFDVLGC